MADLMTSIEGLDESMPVEVVWRPAGNDGGGLLEIRVFKSDLSPDKEEAMSEVAAVRQAIADRLSEVLSNYYV